MDTFSEADSLGNQPPEEIARYLDDIGDHEAAEEIRIQAGLPSQRKKASYVGVPAIFALEEECKKLNDAFGGYGCYLVGSALERPDWRDVDVRLIMSDKEFKKLFPKVVLENSGSWEFDPRWTYMIISISERLSKVTGLPIDFQIQPQTHANTHHTGPRNALGLRLHPYYD